MVYSALNCVGYLVIASFAIASATEECQFNQYSNTKIVSDYSAVLIKIESLQACLTYLKNHKHTHKVVAFDEATHRCCSVLQGLDYSVDNETGWTTFEIRGDHPVEPNTTTTFRPTVTTASTIPPTTATFFQTKGVCSSTSTKIQANQQVTFGLIDYDFDPCVHFESLSTANQPLCKHEITTDNGYYLEVSILHDTAPGSEYLRMFYENAKASFTGVNSAAFSPQVSRLSLEWIANNSRPFTKGFCLKVTAKPKQNYANKTTIGLCETKSTLVEPKKSVVLAILGQDFNACDRLSSIAFNISMDCQHQIYTFEGYSLEFTVRHNINRNDFLALSYDSLSTSISSNGTYLGRTLETFLNARWYNYVNNPVTQNGFCISVTAVPKPNTSGLKTLGVCESNSTYIPANSHQIFSLNSQTFDACFNLSQLSYYPSTTCYHTFYTDKDQVLNFYSSYDIGFDSLEFPQTLYTRVLSGSNEYYGNTISSSANILWSSKATANGKGFCIKVWTSPQNQTSTADVAGICDTARTYLPTALDEWKSFSINSYNGTNCDSLKDKSYRPNTDCWHEIYTERDYVLKLDVLYNTSLDQLVLFAKSAARRIVIGDGVLIARALNNSVFLRWSSDKPTTPASGFCIQATTVPKQIDSEFVTKSICDSGSTEVLANETALFSYINFDYDAFNNFTNITYPNNYECQHEIYTEEGYTLEFSVKYSTQTGFDFLQLYYASHIATLTGENTYNGYFNEPSMILRWKTDAETSGTGFAMSVRSVPAVPRPPAENVAGVLGVCQSTTIAVESDKATIVSVNSYQFNQCDLQFIDFYQNLQRCEATVVSRGSSSNIEFVIHYATVSRGDFLEIVDVNQKSVYFNGYGSSTGVVQSPLKLRWSTGAALRQKGFCLTLKLTNAAPTEALFHEDLISGPVHVESKQLVSIEKQISHGVCARQHATFTLDIDKAAFFSPSSTSVSQCLSLSSLHYDVESENCEVTIKTSGSSFDYSIEYSTKSADNLQISANGLNLGSYHGSGSVSGSFNHREINLAWSSKDAVAAFCLKLIPRK